MQRLYNNVTWYDLLITVRIHANDRATHKHLQLLHRNNKAY